MKTKLILIAAATFILGLWASQNYFKKADVKSKTATEQVAASSYWTCPMHPQIHQDHPGECPICHMKLVQVKAQPKEEQKMATGEAAAVHATSQQLELVGIQKTQVERMSLFAKIPIAGRFITSNALAFQIYESDLHYIKSGVPFKGESSTFSAEEISGVVSSVDSIIDPTSRTVRAIGTIKNGPKGILSETSFSGVIEIELKDRIAIPESAVLHSGQGDLVYLFGESNKLTAKVVKLGLKAEGFYEVVGGLKQGDVISSGPNFLIDSEAKIRGASEPRGGQNDNSHH
jgi:multidrug efflux pump subunit AcrA (membrane-fusion protein)